MKRIVLLGSLLLLFHSLTAQVIINQSSMPVPGDTIHMRTTNSVNGINYSAGGSSHTWNFSTLTSTGMVIDTFVSVLSTPVLYNVAFSNPFDTAHLATVAFKQTMPSVGIITLSEAYAFMKNSASQYVGVGIGVKINGVALPMKFDNPEIMYRFPVTYGTTDSSISTFSATIPTLGYFGESRHRINQVDGWGTLYLPNDTFNVIRVTSVVNYIDTLYMTSLGTGFKVPRTETEYKWLTPGHHEPVLQIIESTGTVRVKYYSSQPYGIGLQTNTKNEGITISPNPATDKLTVTLAQPSTQTQVFIHDINGKTVYDHYFQEISNFEIPVNTLEKGIYLITIQNPQQIINGKFIKE